MSVHRHILFSLTLLVVPRWAEALQSPSPDSALCHLDRGVLYAAQGDADRAIEEFRMALAWDPACADAHIRLGELYMEEGTVAGRIKAEREIRRAIRLDGRDARSHVVYGLLKLKQGFFHNAEAEFKRALELDPDCAEAHYNLGIIYEGEMLRYRDMIDGPIRFQNFAAEAEEKSITSFTRARDLDPANRDVLFRLGLVYYEGGDLDGMAELCEEILRASPNDKDAHLFLGLAAYGQGRGEKAYNEFETAKTLMEDDELAVFESIAPLLSPNEEREYAAASLGRRGDLVDRFWIEQDPLYLTDYNERILEHYGRVAYANLRFGSPEKGIEGWRTDQGKVYIRYGPPLGRVRTRPWIAVGGKDPVHTSVEVWRYRDFDLAFEDMFLNGQYRFRWGTEPETDGLHQYTTLVKEIPQYFDYTYPGKTFDFPCLLATFRGGEGRTTVDVCYALPAQYLDYTVERGQSRVSAEVGTFFFDGEWKSILRDISDEELTTRRIDPMQEHYVTAQRTHQIAPGVYHFALEVRDKETNNTGLLRDTVSIEAYDSHHLQLSDILFASHIDTATEELGFRKGNLEIVPNPREIYSRHEPVYIYYEIYNLRQDRVGRTHYEIEYTVGPEPEERRGLSILVAQVGRLLGKRYRKGRVTATSENRGGSSTERQYVRIDISSVPPEASALTLTVRDLNSNEEVTREAQFVIVE